MIRMVEAIVLTAGFSTRMNKHKALLSFDLHNNFLQHIIHEYTEAGIGRVIVVVNKVNEAEIRALNLDSKIVDIILNERAEEGRLGSIKKGLIYLSQGVSFFIQNIDNPFVDSETIQAMMMTKEKADYVLPVYKEKRVHPILCNSKISDKIVTIEDNDYNLRLILKDFTFTEVQINNKRLAFNINRPEDYKKYFNN